MTCPHLNVFTHMTRMLRLTTVSALAMNSVIKNNNEGEVSRGQRTSGCNNNLKKFFET
jgi:hypothetical protein